MTISTGKTRLRVFRSALNGVKYVHEQPVPFTGHEQAVRDMSIKANMNKNDKYNLDC